MAEWKPESDLGKAHLAHRRRTIAGVQARLLDWSDDVLDAIERLAKRDRNSPVANAHADILDRLHQSSAQQDDVELSELHRLYQEAHRLTFPGATAYLAHSRALAGTTNNHSLDSIQLEELRAIDMLAHEDSAHRKFISQITNLLGKVKSPPDATIYSQVFEHYAEALTLKFLRERGVPTTRIEDDVSAPDFECQLADGRSFFVEVKALEIVGGIGRQNEIMKAGLDVHVEIERQLRQGKSVASATGEVAPYRRQFDDDDYDPCSRKRVIDTLREKCRSAYKSSQFKRGPTFGCALVDRLVIPGGKSELAPYYYDDYNSGACVSGVYWHAAFGRPGSLVLRMPDFEGKPTVEGYLDRHGLWVDPGIAFPAAGLIFLGRSSDRRVSYGLAAPDLTDEAWSSEDTEEAFYAMCDAYNDIDNTRAWQLSRHEIERRAAPPAKGDSA